LLHDAVVLIEQRSPLDITDVRGERHRADDFGA